MEPSQLVIEIIEKQVLPQLQSGEETYLVVTRKQPQVAVLPSLPGVIVQANTTFSPIIHKPAARDRWREEPLIGFIYIIRGEADFLVSRRRVSCHAGNFVFFLPHTWSDLGTSALQKQSASDQVRSDFLWLYLRPTEVLSHLSGVRGGEHAGDPHFFIPDNRIMALAEHLREEVDAEFVSPTATQLLWIIYDCVRRKLREGSFLTSSLSTREISSIGDQTVASVGQRAQEYMDANLMEQMTLESVARALFTSRARLAREFPLHTGETFGAYLLRCRIARAKHLLTTTSVSIKEVSWRAGFVYPDYFSTTFRRFTGSTPTDFRKERR